MLFTDFDTIEGALIGKPFERELKIIMSPQTDAHIKNFTLILSTLAPDGEISYAVTNLNDDDPDNAWAEGKPGPGVGEWLELRPEVAKPLRAILMKPGYQKSEELFRNNARPKKVKVILNGEHSFTADVPDKKAECVIPVHSYAKPVSVIKLIFEEVWPGAKFEDLCVSGVRLEVKLDKKPNLPSVR